jgi:hypothetical protein
MKTLLQIALMVVVVGSAAILAAQEEMPLGDLARSLRKTKGLPSHTVIDNDNMSQVMQEVESRKLKGAPAFSIDESGKNLQMSSPDVTCSLSFSAQATPLISEQIVSQELPLSELIKLDGPAAIDGDTLQVQVYNGSGWNVREITLGLTIVRHGADTAAKSGGSAKLVTAATGSEPVGAEKRSDVTLLYKLSGAAAPFVTTVFKEPLGIPLSADQEWHWAIVRAKGTPPPAAAPVPGQ